MTWLNTLLENPGAGTPILILLVCVGIPVVGAVTVAIAKLVAKHRERIAMIEQGIHPDSVASDSNADLPA